MLAANHSDEMLKNNNTKSITDPLVLQRSLHRLSCPGNIFPDTTDRITTGDHKPHRNDKDTQDFC